MNRILLIASTLVAALVSSAVYAEGLEVVTRVYQEVEVKQNGKTVRQMQPAAKVVPGDEVIYVTSFKNNGNEAAEDIVINNPVPEHLTYAAGSASGSGTEVVVSVDGGQSYDVLSKLRVKEADGSTRAATGADVTHIRWLVQFPLEPGVEGNVTYRARIK